MAKILKKPSATTFDAKTQYINYLNIVQNNKDKNIFTPEYFVWNQENHKNNIKLTVGMPVLNGKDIIWLALESLKNQKNIDFDWELMIIEEDAQSYNMVKQYIKKLPRCVRIIYMGIKHEHGINKQFLLIDKWISILHLAHQQSIALVLHACDDYSPPERLYAHYKMFNENNDIYLSVQKRGVFYNISDKQICLYDGNIILRNPSFCKSIVNNAYRLNKNIKYIDKLYKFYQNKGIDALLCNEVFAHHITRSHIGFTDDLTPKCWIQGFFTQGFHNISGSRSQYFVENIPYIKKNPKITLDVPKYVMNKLAAISLPRATQLYANHNMMSRHRYLLRKLSLKQYVNKKAATLFYGSFNAEDINVCRNHEGKKVIVLDGLDISPNYMDGINYKNNIEFLKKEHVKSSTKIVATTKDISQELKKHDIKHEYENIGWVCSKLKPHRKTKNILIFTSKDDENHYGKYIYDEIMNKLSEKYSFTFATVDKDNKYNNCFIALNLTPFDTHTKYIKELGMCGTPTIHNGGDISTIPWKFDPILFNKNVPDDDKLKMEKREQAVNDIVSRITQESKKIGQVSNTLSQQVFTHVMMNDSQLFFRG